MNRRELLKTAPLWLGSVIATPTILQILASCEYKEKIAWKPLFLDTAQGFVIENLVDIILPTSKNIGALDVNIPQFVDLMLKDVVSESEQNIFIKGSLSFHTKFEEMFKKKIMEGSKEEFLTLISLYFKLPSEKQNQIFEFLKKTEEEVENLELYYIYKYLTFIRHYTLFGFYTSERVGKEILNYESISGSYQACIPISEVGNSSTS